MHRKLLLSTRDMIRCNCRIVSHGQQDVLGSAYLSPDSGRESCGLPSRGYTVSDLGTAASTDNPS